MIRELLHIVLLNCIALAVFSQQNVKLDSIDHIVYLIGDAGSPKEKTSDVFDALISSVQEHAESSTIVFLGDNIYPSGLPNTEDQERSKAEGILMYQLQRLKTLKTSVIFISGNHDWNKGKEEGLSYLINESELIESELGDTTAFMPSVGCPGPEEVVLSDGVVLIALDTQWWLHGHGKSNSCSVSTEEGIVHKLGEMLEKHKDKRVLVCGHHPFKSFGTHGGYMPFKTHIFPLTSWKPFLYVPLPVIGSIYPLYRSEVGHVQDIVHPKYQHMILEVSQVFEKHQQLIYAAGHDHNLQYIEDEGKQYIVSGAGSKTSPVKKLKSPQFSISEKGFFKVVYFTNGEVKITALTVTENNLSEAFVKRIEEID